MPTGSDVVFDLDPLSHDIDVPASSFEVLKSQIQLTLKKKTAGLQWAKLEADDAAPSQQTSSGDVGPHAYPTSSRTGKKNWESITKKELEGTKEDEGVDAFFQSLYKDADDDTKRAMMKSYQEVFFSPYFTPSLQSRLIQGASPEERRYRPTGRTSDRSGR